MRIQVPFLSVKHTFVDRLMQWYKINVTSEREFVVQRKIEGLARVYYIRDVSSHLQATPTFKTAYLYTILEAGNQNFKIDRI